jgi:integrase
MRWSEIVGLRRSQVDLLRRKVRVTEQLVELSDRTRLRKEPKTTAGVRSITISKLTASVLAAHLETFGRADADSLVFTTAAGTPISHSSFQTHHFESALKAAGVEARFHDLRHTSVALAIAAGAHPKAIQMRMGHSSITVTRPIRATCSPNSTKRSPTPSTKAGEPPEPPPAWSPDGAGAHR